MAGTAVTAYTRLWLIGKSRESSVQSHISEGQILNNDNKNCTKDIPQGHGLASQNWAS